MHLIPEKVKVSLLYPKILDSLQFNSPSNAMLFDNTFLFQNPHHDHTFWVLLKIYPPLKIHTQDLALPLYSSVSLRKALVMDWILHWSLVTLSDWSSWTHSALEHQPQLIETLLWLIGANKFAWRLNFNFDQRGLRNVLNISVRLYSCLFALFWIWVT